ncbi:MAG TPA: hypothetical protein VMV07_04815 [Streptosporangiaceae bacterium]|nr:hypothetical protein [Streptosporangiaceae bacterium]
MDSSPYAQFRAQHAASFSFAKDPRHEKQIASARLQDGDTWEEQIAESIPDCACAKFVSALFLAEQCYELAHPSLVILGVVEPH